MTVRQTTKRKECTRCHKMKPKDGFRVIHKKNRPDSLQGMCKPCEREYERERWHTRSAESKQHSGRPARRAATPPPRSRSRKAA